MLSWPSWPRRTVRGRPAIPGLSAYKVMIADEDQERKDIAGAGRRAASPRGTCFLGADVVSGDVQVKLRQPASLSDPVFLGANRAPGEAD